MKTSIRKSQWDALQEAMDDHGRVDFPDLVRIFGTRTTSTRTETRPSDDELYSAYLQAIGEGCEMVTISAHELEALQADIRAGAQVELEIAAEREAERLGQLAIERRERAEADRLWEAWAPWL